MSHDSGFRRGGQDFTHRPPKRSTVRRNRTGAYDRQAQERFHQHEKEHEAKPDEQESTRPATD